MKYTFGLALLICFAAGCQSYQARPLDADAALRAWRERSPSSYQVIANAVARSVSSTQPAFDVSDGLALPEAEIVALVFNPAARKARLEANLACVSAAEAGRWSDPSISVDIERIISGAEDPWVVGGLVNLTIPLSGRLQSERKIAGSEADVARWRAWLVERETISQLRAIWSEWSTAVARATVVEAAVDDLSAIASATAKLRDAGEIDPADARLFEISLQRRKFELINLKRETQRQESKLRELMGLSPAAPLSLAADFDLPTAVEPADLQSHPKVVLARTAYDVAERTFELEIRKQYPDIQIGGGIGTDEGDTRLLGGLSIPLPLFNANRRAIAEARVRRDAARADFEAELFALETLRIAVARDVAAASESIATIEQSLVPLVDQQLAEARRLLAAGEFNPLLVRDAIDSAADTRLELLSAQRSLHKAIAEQLFLTEPLVTETKEGRP